MPLIFLLAEAQIWDAVATSQSLGYPIRQEVIVRKQPEHLVYMVLFLLLSAVAIAGFAGETGKEISYRVLERGEYKEIEVETALASYIFSEDGGVLKSVFLSFAPYGSVVSELVPGTKTDPKSLERQYVANTVFPFSLQQDGLVEEYTLAEVEQPSPDELIIEFRGEIENGTVIKRFTLRNDPYYTVDVEVTVENRALEATSLRMAVGDYLPVEKGRSLVYQFDGSSGGDLLAEGSYASFGGLGLMDKSTVFFLKVDSPSGVTPFMERALSGSRRFGVTLSAPQGTTSYSFSLYGGRRRYLLMEHSGLGTLDNPGAGARMMIPVIQFLEILYRYTGNYGWAIILFTLVTRVILFPLMRKQYHSTAKMQKLQPKLQQIQKRFKDDQQLMQQKLMELYKKEGVNPMGGCLPLFIQLPILVLLWKAILYSGEQIHLSPGFLWVSDLSLRDPYFILVILTTAVMILQQKLTTPMTTGETTGGTSGSQKYMGYIFPIMMAVMLYNFPAGMWLYYLLTTVLQVAQQYFVNWEMAKAEGGTVPVTEIGPMDVGGEEGAKDDGKKDRSGD